MSMTSGAWSEGNGFSLARLPIDFGPDDPVS